MPTEVTTNLRHTVSRSAEGTQVHQHEVIEANRTVARQEVSGSGQSVPLTKDGNQPSNQQLEQATEQMNKHVQNLKRDLHFSIDKDTGETVIRVVDSESHKTIRTIPSEEFLSVQQQLNQSVGMLLNASV